MWLHKTMLHHDLQMYNLAGVFPPNHYYHNYQHDLHHEECIGFGTVPPRGLHRAHTKQQHNLSHSTASLGRHTKKLFSEVEKHPYDFLLGKTKEARDKQGEEEKGYDATTITPHVSCQARSPSPKQCSVHQNREESEKIVVWVSVSCCGKEHQISISNLSRRNNATYFAQNLRSCEPSKQCPAACQCGYCAVALTECDVSVTTPCCNKIHHIKVTIHSANQSCQAAENETLALTTPDTAVSRRSPEKDMLSITIPWSDAQHMEANTQISSTQDVPLTPQGSTCVLSNQHQGRGERQSMNQCAVEDFVNVESVKKTKISLKKLLKPVFFPVVRRHEARQRVSALDEVFGSFCVLGQKKNHDPDSWKKKQNRVCRVYVPDDLEEPAFQYIPDVLPTSATIKGGVPPLQESLMLLAEGLEAGSLVAQFEQLYRRKPGLTVAEARRQDNEKKNRYRDISPYDTTRVILSTCASGDYINASYVNMEVQGSGIVNRYIASQGPLGGTCTDFWYMVWEQQSTLIVMLTTVVEQGRIKCHRYWPRLYETVDFGILQVTCNKEEETPGFAFREFTLINTETQEERHITHMQYLAWPDHGVPDDSTEFLNFVTQVRKARVGMVEPTIVHCSAGIGRTGVLILMETAQCLIEANEPIYPLDIVKAMRDQRAMMIQTASQFRFVCEAIHRVYTEELVKPLAEYQQR